MRKSLAIDLDGTLLQYDGNYEQYKYGEPMPGALEFVKKLIERGHTVTVFTVRQSHQQISDYLVSKGFPRLKVTSTKFGFDMLLDDRAINLPNPSFYLNIDEAVDKIENFRTWWDK